MHSTLTDNKKRTREKEHISCSQTFPPKLQTTIQR